MCQSEGGKRSVVFDDGAVMIVLYHVWQIMFSMRYHTVEFQGSWCVFACLYCIHLTVAHFCVNFINIGCREGFLNHRRSCNFLELHQMLHQFCHTVITASVFVFM